MGLKAVRELEPLTSNNDPIRLAISDPDDFSTLKRGSVSLVIRESTANGQEILMIKRASRDTDRWSGHIALPGGRQDPGETDLETAIRETSEEVGLDLAVHAKYIGSMNPRIIRVSWGRKIALILCPFVFLLNNESKDVLLTLQESEVAASFWYPLASLYHPQNRSWETIPIGDRLNLSGILSKFVIWQSGNMLFDAVDLSPSPDTVTLSSGTDMPPLPWKLWGITLGILQDLRRMIDTEFTVDDLRLPSFQAWDLSALLYIYSSLSTEQKKGLIRNDPKITDWANFMLNGHFKHFPMVIATGIFLRVSTLATGTWLAYRLIKLKCKL